jgi:hypothetical protein
MVKFPTDVAATADNRPPVIRESSNASIFSGSTLSATPVAVPPPTAPLQSARRHDRGFAYALDNLITTVPHAVATPVSDQISHSSHRAIVETAVPTDTSARPAGYVTAIPAAGVVANAPSAPGRTKPSKVVEDTLGPDFFRTFSDGPPIYSNAVVSQQQQQSLLLVQVSPNAQVGSYICVEIPGENRTIAAQVPPGGVSQFYVSYLSQPSPPTAENAAPFSSMPQPQTSIVESGQLNQPIATAPFVAAEPTHLSVPAGHKTLLVQVPPGTTPGTTLHVTVPDEPGRLLAATVPSGNVREFHVTYQPRNVSSLDSSSTTGRPLYQASTPSVVGRSPGVYPQAASSAAASTGYSQSQQAPSNHAGMMGNFLTGAALGALGMGVYDHYAHDHTAAADPYEAADMTGDSNGMDFGDWGGFDF